MWQSYGKGKTTLARQTAHDAASIPKSQKCTGACEKTLPLDHFGIVRGHRRPKCRMCRASAEVKANNLTVPGADRNGLPWEKNEHKFIADRKDLSDHDIAVHLKRTISGVRACRKRIGAGRKRVKATPKPIYDCFEWNQRPEIKRITVEARASTSTITVWSKTGTHLMHVANAFVGASLTKDDFKAWKIGVTAGA